MSNKRYPVLLTVVEAGHLLQLLGRNETEGSYYGDREQYWARHERIARVLTAIGEPDPDPTRPR